MSTNTMDDKTYRALAHALLDELCVYFDEVDPDEIEADLIPGALTLTTADGSKFIVSEQGAQQQVWLATPEVGRRYDYAPARNAWIDPKDGTALREVLAAALSAKTGRSIAFT